KHIDKALSRRHEIDRFYRSQLQDVKGIQLLEPSGQHVSNYAYFPILVDADYPLTRDELYDEFRRYDIYVRRYFYPLISSFPMYRGLVSAQSENLPIAVEMANKVLCLPIYSGLSVSTAERVVQVIDSVT